MVVLLMFGRRRNLVLGDGKCKLVDREEGVEASSGGFGSGRETRAEQRDRRSRFRRGRETHAERVGMRLAA